MSDLDTLIVTFQTQLSDVMETVVKTAMYEVTRLVEEGFLEEVKRRNQEVESLRMQLQWAENKLNNQDENERKSKRCADCTREDGELSTADAAEEKLREQQDDILRDGAVKTEGDSVDKWSRSCRREIVSASPQAAGDTTATVSEGTSQAAEEDHVLPDVDVKEEIVKSISCSSVHLGGWSCAIDDGPEPNNTSETSEAQPKQTQENSEELARDATKPDRQTSAGYVFPENLEDTHMATDESHTSSLELNRDWASLTVTAAGLLQNHRLAADTDCDPAKDRSHVKRTDHKVSSSVSVSVCAQVTPGRDQIATPGSPKARLQNSSALGVIVKQEVVVDSDGCEETQPIEKKMKKSGTAHFSCSVKPHNNRVSSDEQKQNHIPHKASVQEVMKLHSKVGTGLRLQAAIQHLHRPMKKPSATLSNSTTAALSAAHSQVVNFNRLPSTSKSIPLSVQRVHLGDKQSATLNRASAPWVSVKTQHQSANSHHADSLPHPDSHIGPRHLLRCGQCGKCFPHPSNLKAHLQTHTGERPFCCSLCGRSFTKLSNLKAHRRVHTGERPYCCLACGKRFTQKCNLKRHQRIHLDV